MPVIRLLGAGSEESGSAQSSRPSLAKPLTSSMGELRPHPVVVDDRDGLRAEEFADASDLLPLRIGQQLLVGIEVGGQQAVTQVGLRL